MATILYRFENLDIHSAIIIQGALDRRKEDITTPEGNEAMKAGDKAFKAVIGEIDQMYDDLDRYIASCVRMQEYQERAKTIEARDAKFKQVIGE